MQYFKLLLLFLAIFILAECNQDDEYSLTFGETETGFILDSIYRTQSSGMLYVQFDANSGYSFLQIFADSNETPDTEIGRIRAGSSATIPLHKDIYWIVKEDPDNSPFGLPIHDTLITWTPIY